MSNAPTYMPLIRRHQASGRATPPKDDESDESSAGAYAPVNDTPAATPLDEFPSYLRALTAKQGLLAEMLRVISWELPEMLASVAAVRTSSAFTNVCLDGLLADQRMFDASISDLLDALGVHATTAALPDLSAIYVRDHHLAAATRRQLSEDIHRFDEIHFDGFFRDASRFVREATRCEWSWIT